jgi:hypothetical protein
MKCNKQCNNCRFAKLSQMGKKTKLVCSYMRRNKPVKASHYCEDWQMSFRK